ncbi:MAG: UDP-N-acetylmuramate dehydrogenase [Phycisphaerales bacterium]|nr:UDP-N-acetylmuramate dehydrogenase [Phycisphaerales bacterium]
MTEIEIQRNVPIETWFDIGGGAERLARPENVDDIRRCLEVDPNLRVLGDGANLLVDDAGVDELVIKLDRGEVCDVCFDDENCRVVAGAGVNLPKLILETIRRGMSGLEGLGGVPASIGGAAIMNAGGTFGQFCDVASRVHGVDRSGAVVTLERNQIDYSYRHSGLGNLIVTSVELKLRRDDPSKLRAKLKDVMSLKKKSQPLGESSAGCVFKNPTLRGYITEIGPPGARVSAGLLIDRAGCKGLKVGGARVSDRHGNFITTKRGATTADVLALMEQVGKKVEDKFGLRLEPEVVIWRRR